MSLLPSFAYAQPATLRDAARRLAEPGAQALAGGTDLLGCLRDGAMAARTVVSLSALRELAGVSESPDGSVRIGALTTLAELATHSLIRDRWTALAEAAASAASPQLRNQGTLGGNLCQRPRCWYFRSGFDCARKGGSVCYAMEGENERHAIFGGSSCYMVHPSDTAPALVALDGRARLVSAGGERTVPLERFFVLPEEDVTRENVLRPGEVLAEVILPPRGPQARSHYAKVRERATWDFALVGTALLVEFGDGIVRRARIVLSGVAPVPWRAEKAEAALVGRRLDATTAGAAAEKAVAGAEPLAQNAYKVDLVRSLLRLELLALA